MGEWGIMGGFGIVVAAIVAGGLSPWRFLPSQEWSTCVRGIVGGFGIVGGGDNWRIRRQCRISRWIPVLPRGPFLRRQESHSDVFALSPKLSGVAAR